MVSCGHRRDIFEVAGNSVRWLFTWNKIRYKALTHAQVLFRSEECRAWIPFQYLNSVKPQLCQYRCTSVRRDDCGSYVCDRSPSDLSIGLCTSNCRARATGNSELAVTAITTSNGVDTSVATQLWTLLSWLDGCLAVLATWFKDIPMPSVNNACTGICTQVEVSLLPAESALRREEGRVVKPLTNCISHALLGFCWCCSVQDDLGQAVAAAQREFLPLTSCCQGRAT